MNHRETAAEAELRQRTDFSPLVRGGMAFCTHTLDRSETGRIRVVPTFIGRCIGLVFFFAAAVLLIPVFLTRAPGLLVMPVLFSLIGIFPAVRVFGKRAVFDLVNGRFERKKLVIPFRRIAALQVVKEICRTKNSSFPSWELNLVLDDASRINIFDHGNRKRFDADLAALAEALGKPIWEERKPTPPAAPGPVALGLVGVALLAIASLIFMVTTGMPLFRWSESRHWIAVPATVTESQLVTSRGSKGRTNYRLQIYAEYDWEGKRYTCHDYDFFRSSISTNLGVGEMRRIVREHPVGRQCECLVDPGNPAAAVMSREVPVGLVIFASLITFPFEAIGFGLLIAALRHRGKPAGSRKKRRRSGSAAMPRLRADGSAETAPADDGDDAEP